MSGPSAAQTRVAPVRLPAPDAGIEHLSTEVAVDLDGRTRVARFEVQARFRNASARVLVADFLYAIPRGAVFTNLSLFAGETELRGEMLRGDEARGVFEEIVRRRRDPALVELAGRDLLRARVFPVEPGETRKIVLRYAQVLPTEAAITRLSYPRSRPALIPVDDPRRSPRTGTPESRSPLVLSVTMSSASRFGTPVSPTHTIDVSRRDGDRLAIVARVPGTGADFELLLPWADRTGGAGLVTHSPDPARESGYFMLLLTPPAVEGRVRIARDVTVVLDVSGSMSGRKIDQARAAIEAVLRSLDAGDRFGLITFSSVVRGFSAELVAATAANLDAALRFLRSIPADGSTNVDEALQRALAASPAPGRTTQIVLLTDGRPTAGETDPVRIAAHAEAVRDGERLFAFGVGDDVNTFLLDQLALGGRGSVQYVSPDEDVEGAVAALNRRIGAPALTDLRIVEAPVDFEELFPESLPDLFHGEELTLFGRYRRGGSGELVIEGERGGQRVRLRYDLEFPERRAADAFVARLWAARKAGALTARIRLEGPDPELVSAIRELGLRYGVLTEYTAYLVQEPDADAGEWSAADAVDQLRREARAPREQTGGEAFRDSRRSAKLRQATSVQEAEAMIADAVAPPPAAAFGEWAEAARALGSRRLVLRGETWTDIAHRPEAATIRIAPFSDAWLEIAAASGGISEVLALGERVIIAGKGLSLIVAADGLTRLDRAARARLGAAFPELGW